ncbi:MAG: branched-chain-amino-acid transaminase [Candidatus Aminicenantales bacterium]
MDNNLIIYLNGQFLKQSEAKISVFDQGILFGDGVFEGIRVYNRKIFKCQEHINRLYDSAKAIMLDIPLNKEELKEVMLEICRRNKIVDGYIRLVVTRGIGDLTLYPVKITQATVFCIAATITLYPSEVYQKGMSIITSARRTGTGAGVDPQIKSLNYLNHILAKIEAHQVGKSEALMLTNEGIVAECTGDNIFIVKDNLVCTPPIHVGLLAGITRNTIINLADKMGIKVIEKEFTLFNVYSADECFLSGTAAEVVPVREVDGRLIGNGKPGLITKKLLTAFQEYAKTHGTPIYKEEKHEK